VPATAPGAQEFCVLVQRIIGLWIDRYDRKFFTFIAGMSWSANDHFQGSGD
jgi:hypothetical protein